MSKGDNTKTRTTRELDAAKLAALAKESTGTAAPVGTAKTVARGSTRIPRIPEARVHAAPTVPVPSTKATPRTAPRSTESNPPITVRPSTEHETPIVSVGRTNTLDDPFTTGLLAEVARRSQTKEFDEDVLEEVLGSLDKPDNRHPHTKRRSG